MNLVKKTLKGPINSRIGLKAVKFLASMVEPGKTWCLVNDEQIRGSKSISDLPKLGRISGFHDLSFLFRSWGANRGLILMDFDEAAYLFKIVSACPENSTCVEIGRGSGASTLLMASALRGNSPRLISLDIDSARDETIHQNLKQFGLDSRADLITCKSDNYDNKNLNVNLVFIDGDHTYEGVKADYEHWVSRVVKGGDILFHDYCDWKPGVPKFIAELRLSNQSSKLLTEVHCAGSLLHFRKN